MKTRGFKRSGYRTRSWDGGYSTTVHVYAGRLRLEAQPLTFLSTEKGTPFAYLLLINGTLFRHTLFRTLHPFQLL